VLARVGGRVQRGAVCPSNHDPRRASGCRLNLRERAGHGGAGCGDRARVPVATGVRRPLGDGPTSRIGAQPPGAGGGEGDGQRRREASRGLASGRCDRADARPAASTAVRLEAGASRAELTSGGVRRGVKVAPPSVERRAPAIIPVGQTAQTTREEDGLRSPPSPGMQGPVPVTNVRPPSVEPASRSWRGKRVRGVASSQTSRPRAARSNTGPVGREGERRLCPAARRRRHAREAVAAASLERAAGDDGIGLTVGGGEGDDGRRGELPPRCAAVVGDPEGAPAERHPDEAIADVSEADRRARPFRRQPCRRRHAREAAAGVGGALDRVAAAGRVGERPEQEEVAVVERAQRDGHEARGQQPPGVARAAAAASDGGEQDAERRSLHIAHRTAHRV
jgi:hypothetical protein